MGRREVAAVSSPITAESTFRKLDDVFLQTQTRIWLGEVLNVRLLNEELHISELLADGELLYEVSKVLWNMLLANFAELRLLKYKPLHSQKSSRRFRPYINVDSFLKICKILGLNSIDLFSPSDVVEKRNIRKVCICIRTLSKKARLKHLKVPDFDMVSYNVAMPKDMVGCIRRSLETSQHSFSSSSSNCSYNNDQGPRVTQKNLTESGDKNYDSCSEESDEAESKYTGKDPCCSSTNDVKDFESSPGAESSTKPRTFDSHICDQQEGNYISDYLAFSDSVICGTQGNGPVLLEGDDYNIFNFFTGKDSHIESDDMEDMEVSSTASMSSLLGRVLNLEFDDHFDLDGSLDSDAQHDELLKSDHLGLPSEGISQCQDDECNEKCGEEDVNAAKVNHKSCLGGFQSLENGSISQRFVTPISCEAVEEQQHSLSLVKESQDDDASGLPQTNEVDRKHEDSLAENDSDEKDNTDVGVPKEKANRIPFLLNTVAGGTAIFGVVFLLLHLSRRGGVKNSDANKKMPENKKKLKGREISYRDGHNNGKHSGRDRIYPADKLRFKN
ncbi:hypothetical protein DM860_011069 [Cuscuta australis]|uniref:Calponin-homology (CH) domain-containing protein n=1 Tax=Cuscuta australis TaxID=267555 RepID=A0A328E107_9ASTE|nr:hypothetical protein DM860_011069 [Cuscuta australis]